MTLHCVYARSAILAGDLARNLAADDAVLLLGAAVTLARESPGLPEGIAVHALAEDLAAHGIGAPAPGVSAVDYDGWVALTETHATQQVWA